MALFAWATNKKQPPIDRRRSLAGIPVLNPGVAVEEAEDGLLVAKVKLKRGTGFFARFQPAVMERNVELDELGSFVLGEINGKRTTRDIVNAFAKRYSVNRREAELSCVAFLRSLAQRRVISVAIK